MAELPPILLLPVVLAFIVGMLLTTLMVSRGQERRRARTIPKTPPVLVARYSAADPMYVIDGYETPRPAPLH